MATAKKAADAPQVERPQDAYDPARSPADAKWREVSARPQKRQYLDMLDRLAFACPSHREWPSDAAAKSYEGEVGRCRELVRRPSERECLEALKELVAECRDFDPVAKGCDDGWPDLAEAEEHCWALFRAALADAEATVRDAMRCEVCGDHPGDEWSEWGCYTCGIECCGKCLPYHVCAEEKLDARDIELASEARRR
jgi:hypothetical protein